jgi:hypothetical protein
MLQRKKKKYEEYEDNTNSKKNAIGKEWQISNLRNSSSRDVNKLFLSRYDLILVFVTEMPSLSTNAVGLNSNLKWPLKLTAFSLFVKFHFLRLQIFY